MRKHNRQTTPPPITACVRPVEYASYTYTHDGCGVLFDEINKQHWQLNASHFHMAIKVAANQGQTRFSHLARSSYPDATDDEIYELLKNLWQTGLFAEWDFKPLPPPRGMVIEFLVLNLSYRIRLKLFGWKRVVAPIRLVQFKNTPIRSSDLIVKDAPPIVEQLVAVALLSYPIPTTDALCVPVALTFYRMLKRRGYPCSLMIGSPPSPLLPHMWVELDGYVIDTVVYRYGEHRYRALSQMGSATMEEENTNISIEGDSERNFLCS